MSIVRLSPRSLAGAGGGQRGRAGDVHLAALHRGPARGRRALLGRRVLLHRHHAAARRARHGRAVRGRHGRENHCHAWHPGRHQRALRPLGAGTAGIETVFFLLVLAGRVFGAGFGFLLGSTSMFASALLTGGVGPWLPFQMLAASWVGLGAGLLPKAVRGRGEIAMLAAYGVVAAYFYGTIMNLWFWPFATGNGTGLSYVAGAPLLTNLHRFALFDAATSLGWDTGRAITNVVAITVLGTAVLSTLRRAARKAAFDAPVVFEPVA